MNWKEYKVIYDTKIRKVPVHATLMGEFYNRYVSIYMTFIMYKAKFSANFVTVLSFFAVLIAMTMINTGRGLFCYLIHIVLLQLSGIIDIVDGQIARLNNSGSKFGQFLDLAIDRISLFAVYLGYGLALYQDGDLGNIFKVVLFILGAFAYVYYCELGLIRSIVFAELSGTMQNLKGNRRSFLIKLPYQFIHLNVVLFIYSIGYSLGWGYATIIMHGIFTSLMCIAQFVFIGFTTKKKTNDLFHSN